MVLCSCVQIQDPIQDHFARCGGFACESQKNLSLPVTFFGTMGPLGLAPLELPSACPLALQQRPQMENESKTETKDCGMTLRNATIGCLEGPRFLVAGVRGLENSFISVPLTHCPLLPSLLYNNQLVRYLELEASYKGARQEERKAELLTVEFVLEFSYSLLQMR